MTRQVAALRMCQDLLCENLSHDQLIQALRANGLSAADLLVERDSIAMAVLLCLLDFLFWPAALVPCARPVLLHFTIDLNQ